MELCLLPSPLQRQYPRAMNAQQKSSGENERISFETGSNAPRDLYGDNGADDDHCQEKIGLTVEDS
jgi:hypothetical protein